MPCAVGSCGETTERSAWNLEVIIKARPAAVLAAQPARRSSDADQSPLFTDTTPNSTRIQEHCDACCPSEEDDKNFPHIYRTHHGLNDRTSSTTNARQGRICRSGSLYVSAV
ncbi:hypothetical protein Bbelb_041340 [Branchiostoma belcheri]|nr:hypothetical protein Bbelb_041340 [Branchiostoma belcheri]